MWIFLLPDFCFLISFVSLYPANSGTSYYKDILHVGNMLSVRQIATVFNKHKKSLALHIYFMFTFIICWYCSVTQSCPTLCDPMDCSTPGLPVHHQFPELSQTRVHWVGDAIQPSHPLLSPSPPAFNLSQPQGLFQWVSSSRQVAKVLEIQLQHQSF